MTDQISQATIVQIKGSVVDLKLKALEKSNIGKGTLYTSLQ